MESNIMRELLARKKNFVFIGEAGSGKSELAMNFAQLMAEVSEKPVHLFDMDQTKGLFRTRDVSELLEERASLCTAKSSCLTPPPLCPASLRH